MHTVHTYMHTIHTYVHTYIHTYIHTVHTVHTVHTYINVCQCLPMYVHNDTSMLYIHSTLKHTHIHTYIHTLCSTGDGGRVQTLDSACDRRGHPIAIRRRMRRDIRKGESYPNLTLHTYIHLSIHLLSSLLSEKMYLPIVHEGNCRTWNPERM